MKPNTKESMQKRNKWRGWVRQREGGRKGGGGERERERERERIALDVILHMSTYFNHKRSLAPPPPPPPPPPLHTHTQEKKKETAFEPRNTVILFSCWCCQHAGFCMEVSMWHIYLFWVIYYYDELILCINRCKMTIVITPSTTRLSDGSKTTENFNTQSESKTTGNKWNETKTRNMRHLQAIFCTQKRLSWDSGTLMEILGHCQASDIPLVFFHPTESTEENESS